MSEDESRGDPFEFEVSLPVPEWRVVSSLADGSRGWGIVSAIYNGVRQLFPTPKTKAAMWGIVGLGVLITYMELTAARLFSSLVTGIEDEPAARTVLFLGGFLLTFAAIKGIQYFQNVYRLTIFEKSLRQVSSGSRSAETWRWPMAIALVGMMGQIARLLIVTLTVATTAWMYGVLLMLCTVVAVVIVNRTGRVQYAIHRQFAAAKLAGNPPSAAERIGTRVRAGERAGLVAVGPVLLYVAALGAGAATGRVSTHSAIVLFIAGRMAANMYGSLSTATMRFIRCEVNVEAYGGTQEPTRTGQPGGGPVGSDEDVRRTVRSGGYLCEPPQQAFARLVDDGYYVGDAAQIGRMAREVGFGPNRTLRRQGSPTRPEKLVAVAPNQVWTHEAFVVPVEEVASRVMLQVIIDTYSRSIVVWRFDAEVTDSGVEALFLHGCKFEGVAPDDVELYSTRPVLGRFPNLHDLLKSLGVVRTLTWTGPADAERRPRAVGPTFPTTFATKRAAEDWISAFVAWHNKVFYQPDIGYLHPADVHAGLADVITTERLVTVEAAAEPQNSDFVRALPDEWRPPEEVWIEQLSVRTIAQEPQDSEQQALEEEDEEL